MIQGRNKFCHENIPVSSQNKLYVENRQHRFHFLYLLSQTQLLPASLHHGMWDVSPLIEFQISRLELS